MLLSLVSLFLLLYLQQAFGIGEENLGNALNSIENRQKQLASSYYVLPNKDTDRSLQFDDNTLMYLDNTPSDYDVPSRSRFLLTKPSKNFRIYLDDPSPDLESEEYQKSLNERLLEQLMLDVLKNDDEIPDRRPQKKSFFREREINKVSDNLQNLQPDFNIDDVSAERIKSKLRSPHRRVTQSYDLEDLNGDYLNAVNPLWRKYDDQSIRDVDPESLSSEDIDDFLKYLGSKGVQDDDDDDDEYTREIYTNENQNGNRDRSKRYWLGSNQPNLIRKRSLNSPGKPKVWKLPITQQLNETASSDGKKITNSTEEPKHELKRDKKGQKEVPVDLKSLKPLNIKKKSIDWSNYFGVDKRQKKSNTSPKDSPKNDVLLDQYIQSYILQSVRNSAFNDRGNGYGYYPKRNNFRKMKDDDVHKKLETAEDLKNSEDLIIDHVLKYTGAHQGTTDPKELQRYRERVINELGAAYNLEKLRNEIFQNQKPNSFEKRMKTHQHTSEKRVAAKKENAEFLPSEVDVLKVKQNATAFSNHGTPSKNFLSNKYSYEIEKEANECPLLNEIIKRCFIISANAKDYESTFTPVCALHNICNICGTKDEFVYCDLNFYSDINLVCSGEDPLCKYTAERVLAALQKDETRSFVTNSACDPCVVELSQYSYK